MNIITFLLTLLISFPLLAKDEGIKVVAVVNDDIITSADVSRRVDMMVLMSGIEDNEEIRRQIGGKKYTV